MKKIKETLFYISICIGIAINTSSFAIIAGMFIGSSVILVLVSIVLAGFFCIIISDSVSELASRYPSAPGVRTYFKKAFSEKSSLFLVYSYLIFVIIAGAVESSLFAYVYKLWIPEANSFLLYTLMLSIIVLANLVGFKLSRDLQILATILLVTLILFLGASGIINNSSAFTTDHFSITNFSISDSVVQILYATGLSIFLFIGFEWVTPLGYSRDSYKNRIPLSMPFSILFNVVVYSVFIIGLSLVMSDELIAKELLPQIQLSKLIFPEYGKYIVISLASVCIISTFNAGIMGGSKLIYALGREKKLPSFFVKKSLSNGVPYVAILALGVTVELLTVFINTSNLELTFATAATAIMCMIYIALIIAAKKIEKKNPGRKAAYIGKFSYKIKSVVMVVLFVIGALTVFSIPDQEIEIFTILLVTFLLSILLTKKFSGNPL